MTDLSRSNGRDGDFYKSLGGLETMMDAHEKRLDAIERKLDRLIEMSAGMKGGWKALSAIVLLAATIGAGSSRVIEAIRQFLLG